MKSILMIIFIIIFFTVTLNVVPSYSSEKSDSILLDLGPIDLRYKITLYKTTQDDIYKWLGSPKSVHKGDTYETWDYSVVRPISREVILLYIFFINGKVVRYNFTNGHGNYSSD